VGTVSPLHAFIIITPVVFVYIHTFEKIKAHGAQGIIWRPRKRAALDFSFKSIKAWPFNPSPAFLGPKLQHFENFRPLKMKKRKSF
jgi:hypothetical protein